MEHATCSILLVSPVAMVRQGLRILLEAEPDFGVAGEAINEEETVALLDELSPHITLFYVTAHQPFPEKLIVRIAQHSPHIPLVIVAATDTPDELKILSRYQHKFEMMLINPGVEEVLHKLRECAEHLFEIPSSAY